MRVVDVRASTGEGRALVIPVTVSPANVDEPSGLVVAVVENRYDVLYLNLREANLSFGYRFSKKSERKVAETAAQPKVVAAQLAEK